MARPDSEGAPGGVRRRERAEEKGCLGRYYTVRGEAIHSLLRRVTYY